MTTSANDEAGPVTAYDWSGVRSGMRAAISLAGLVLSLSFIGFGAFVHGSGFPFGAGLASIPLIWALPGQVLFVEMWTKGQALAVIGLAVTVSAVRLLPMAMLVLSEARLKGAARWPEFVLTHFIALTLWVVAGSRLKHMTQPRKLPFLLGLGVALMSLTLVSTTIGYVLSDMLPPVLSATMVFFTPAFFLVSLFNGARWRFDYLAIALGAGFGPLATLLAPQFDLVLAGVGGGTLAFFLMQPRRRGLIK